MAQAVMLTPSRPECRPIHCGLRCGCSPNCRCSQRQSSMCTSKCCSEARKPSPCQTVEHSGS